MTLHRPILEVRRSQIDRVQQVSAQDTWLTSRLQIEGVGEVKHDVPFPVLFGERPMALGGIPELDPNYEPLDRQYPTMQVTVSRWLTRYGSGGLDPSDYYTGAELTIVVTGDPGQLIWATFSFIGTALTNVPGE